MKKKNSKNVIVMAVKASRKESREEEIRLHGKPVGCTKIQESKKIYSRKINKADADEALPFSIVCIS